MIFFSTAESDAKYLSIIPAKIAQSLRTANRERVNSGITPEIFRLEIPNRGMR